MRKKNVTKSVSIENVGGSLDDWHLEGRQKIKYFFKQNFLKWNKLEEWRKNEPKFGAQISVKEGKNRTNLC